MTLAKTQGQRFEPFAAWFEAVAAPIDTRCRPGGSAFVKRDLARLDARAQKAS
jgi:hypothetical protein